MKSLLAALLLMLVPSLVEAQSVVLWNKMPPKPNETFREEITIRLEGGTLSLGLGNGAINAAASAHIHDIAERTYTSTDQQKVDILDSSRNIHFSFGGQAGEPKDEAGHLLGQKLLGAKVNNRWTFTLASKRKPDDAQATALKQFAGYTEAVEAFGGLYGPTPRKVGETWKPDLSALKSTDAKIDADLECKLEEVKPQKDDQIATISIKGHLFAAVGDNGKLQIAINALIHRSLHEMVDLDTAINGNLKYHGAFGKTGENQKGGAEADIEAPLTLTRTVNVAKR
jgi:hypothetical protein